MFNFRLEDLERSLRPLNTSDDLVKLGVFRCKKTAANKRCAGSGPDYVRIVGCGIRYPKRAVLEWLERNTKYIKQQGQ